ncbi:DUF1287 domain-containing protein [Hellea balneolensis]|uniref:DUF1287 domain-containing protein n=1 Tax=Hellea balneolensis TaxID=287478 RepID=UPI0004233097|nr:DUF1287 domain-containing protein [Hellea balneolensis]
MRILFSLIFSCLLTSNAFAGEALVAAAQDRLKEKVIYNGAYMRLDYPGGDVPANIGVCTDVIIRSYRAAFGFDFQKAVHEDMKANFSAYPKNWGLKRTDRNIDHRRVPNLETYLKRQGASLGISRKAKDFKPGDIVSWRIAGRLPHIGIVSDRRARDGNPLIIHNVGAGPQEENVLFAYKMTGHFRFIPQTED